MRRSVFIGTGLALVALLSGTTDAAVTRSSSPNVTVLPDNGCLDDVAGTGLGGITDTIDYSDLSAGVISDVNVRVEMTQTWRGDIQAALTLSTGGGAVVLINGHDGSADNYFATLDDEGAGLCSDATTGCGNPANCGAAPGPTCQPNQPLSAFDGLNAGLFTLSVCDAATGDTGNLVLWELTVDGTPPLPVDLTGFSVE